MGARRRLRHAALRLLATRLQGKRALFLFERLAERFRVEEVVARGAWGAIQGKLDDEVVFGRYLREGTWSPELVGFLRGCFAGASAGTFLDVGANLGLVTIPIAQLGPIDCRCFEPEPENLALLRRNLARNAPDARVEVLPIALYREETTVEFELAGGNRGDHRIRAAGGPAGGAYGEAGRAVIRVPARPLDAVVDPEALAHPLVIKSDAQGAELHVWAGGERTFARADALVLEFWPYGLERMGSAPLELAERLAKDFARGALLRKGDAIRPRDFAPIDAVAEALRRFCREARPGEHADVLAAKEPFWSQVLAAPLS